MKRASILLSVVAALVVGFLLGNRMSAGSADAETPLPGTGYAAIPGQKGGQDIFGPYDAVRGWPKPLSGLPGNEKWTWGSAEGIFAESPNRVFILQRGQLPNIQRPRPIKLPQLGPNVEFPIGRLPWRDATSTSPPSALDGDDSDVGTPGVDFTWENCLVAIDANGNITERWTQWDKSFRRAHSIYIDPYDATKAVWVVEDYRHVLFKYSNDGKQLLQTIGEFNVRGNDDKHFYRPTYMAFLPEVMFVADGYGNTRVVKLDKSGKFLMAWGEKGEPPNPAAGQYETRGGYFNNVHGVAVDPETRRVFVNDRGNKRIQVFDENGKFLDQWSTGPAPSEVHLIYIGADRKLWAADRGTNKMIQYDLDGHLLYAWGAWGGEFAGGFWGVHGVSVDQEGNFYASDVDRGGGQKWVPRPGANPAMLIGKPVKAAW